MKYMSPVSANQRTPTGVTLSLSSATKAMGSCDVLSRDPSSTSAAQQRPTTALPRYMQDTAVSRQRTFFFGRPSQTSRQPPKSARLSSGSEGITQAKIDGRPTTSLRRSITVVEGDSAATQRGGLVGGDQVRQGSRRTDPLERIGRGVHVDAGEEAGLEEEGIVIEEVTVPLDLSCSVVQSSSGIEQRPLLPRRFSGGVTLSSTDPVGFVKLPDISSSSSTLRRVVSELPLIESVYLQRERLWKQEPPEDRSRASFSSSDSSPIDYDVDSRHPSAMGDHRRSVGGPSASAVDGPHKRSMPSAATTSSGSSHNVLPDSRRPSKIQLTDGTDGPVFPGGSTTTRQNDDVFFRPMPRQSSMGENVGHPPSTIDTARRVPVSRQSSVTHQSTRNGDIAKDTVLSPHSLSEDALRILDEMNLANDLTRVQNNLERFQRTSRTTKPRLSLPHTHHPKNISVDAAGGRQRRPPAGPPAVVAEGKGLLRTSKSQPNLIRTHQHLYRQQQSGVRNQVNGSRNARKGQPFKSEDLEDENDEYDEDDERTETLKRERIVRWLIGTNEFAEPPPGPPTIEDDRPPQTDNAIHIVYKGDL